MAFIRKGSEWAWVDSPDETPRRFYATKDEALAAVKEDGKTFDAAPDSPATEVYSVEPGEWA